MDCKVCSGAGQDYILIHLMEGGVSLTINQSSGKLDTAIKPQGQSFNDNTWHQVTLSRETKLVRLKMSFFFLATNIMVCFQEADGQTSCQVGGNYNHVRYLI